MVLRTVLVETNSAGIVFSSLPEMWMKLSLRVHRDQMTFFRIFQWKNALSTCTKYM